MHRQDLCHGEAASNVSPSVISHLKSVWKKEYEAWQKRDLSSKKYVYWWADGIYLQARMDAYHAFDSFIKRYKAKYPKACEYLVKDKEELMAFYDFPAEHWKHLRTTNPIESTFATVRHRTKRSKRLLLENNNFDNGI